MIEDRGISIPLIYPPLNARIEGAFRDGWYEEGPHAFVLETLRADHVVLEFGTGLGFMATLASNIAAAVHTYEANPELEGYLHTIFKANGVAPFLHMVGIAPDNGQQVLTVGEEAWSSSFVPRAMNGFKEIAVPCISGQEALEASGANYLLCDIEGCELLVLEEMDLSPLDVLVLEIHPWAVAKTHKLNLNSLELTASFLQGAITTNLYERILD